MKALSDVGSFLGLAAAYGNLDLGGDVVEPGAFTKTLQDRGSELPILWAHDVAQPVGLGRVSDISAGLRIEGTLDLDVQAGKEAYSRLRKGIVKGLSIGYRVVADTIVNGVRHLKQLDLYEVSLVALPMNPAALVTSVKAQIGSVRDFEAYLHRAGWSNNESKRLASRGWPGLESDEPDGGAEELLTWLRQQNRR